MNMFEFAIQMEKDAESLYRDLADRTRVGGIKKVLNMLAEDEVRHRKSIEKLQNNQESVSEKGVANDIKTVFEEIRHNFQNVNLEGDFVKDYEKALEIEKKGMAYYKEQFENANDEASKKLFELLMKQESYHYKTVENLIDMVRKPDWWVENAEFNPKGDDYY